MAGKGNDFWLMGTNGDDDVIVFGLELLDFLLGHAYAKLIALFKNMGLNVGQSSTAASRRLPRSSLADHPQPVYGLDARLFNIFHSIVAINICLVEIFAFE